jgi:hypothetical protein
VFVFFVLFACNTGESNKDAPAQRFLGGFTDVQSDGCGPWPEGELWIRQLRVAFTHEHEQLSFQGWIKGEPKGSPYPSELEGQQFACDLVFEDDQFRKDEGVVAVMRESAMIEGAIESDEVLSGTPTLRVECIGDDCEEAEANAWKVDGKFDHPLELPCANVVGVSAELTDDTETDP